MLDLEDFLGNEEEFINTDDRDFTVGDEPANTPEETSEASDDQQQEPGFDLENDPGFADTEEEEEQQGRDTGGQEPQNVQEDAGSAQTDDQLSVVEAFLERYNIRGGELETESGEKVLFRNLTPEQQVRVLEQVVDSTGSDVAGLAPDEKYLINAVRESNLSVQDFMVLSAQEFSDMNKASGLYDVPEYQFEAMDNDLIYSTYILSNNPDITQEVLEQELEHAKKSPLYETTVSALRNSFIEQREVQKQAYLDQERENRIQEAVQQSARYVQAARSIDEVAGWPLDDDAKNSLLESFVELDGAGKSRFDREIVQDPGMALKAMWFLQNGEENFRRMDAYYKEQLRAAYNKGVEDSSSGKVAKSVRQTAVKEKNTAETPSKESDKKRTLEDFIYSK